MNNGLKEKVSNAVNTLVLHWKTPPLGKYVPYKEILAYGFGGMGVQFVMFFATLISLNATSFLVGNTIGIKPMHLQYMSIIATIIGFGITISRSYIIDCSHFKMGKFRPWLAIMGIPAVAITIIFVWLPYETMSYMQKLIAVFVCYISLQMFYPFFTQAHTDLANVISPNSHERTDIVSFASIIYSLAPTLTGMFVPMLSTFTGGLNNINTYRVIHPIIAIIGLLMSYIAVFGTKERIIVAESHVSTFKFTDAFRSVARNKYFWITSLAGWLGFLESAVTVIIGWTFIYAYPDRMPLYGIATTLIGNASLWSMLICPIAIRKIGKRNLLIWCNLANIVLIGSLYNLYDNLFALIAIYYLNGFVTNFAIVYNPGINADIRDYQQYYTGERIDGMFGAVGIIGSFIGMFTGMVLPTIYQRLGLEDNYDVLEVASFREDLFEVLIIAAVIGAALNVLPYFFYDLTEAKQQGIVKVLKIRALFEDYGNGFLKDKNLVETIDIIDEANALYTESLTMTTKDDVKAAKHLPDRTAQEKAFKKAEIARLSAAHKEFVSNLKAELKACTDQAKSMPNSTDEQKAARKAAIKAAHKKNSARKKHLKDVSVCHFVIDEMNKYETLAMQKKVDRSKVIIKNGIEGIFNYDGYAMREAKAMPKSTHDERIMRGDAIVEARALNTAHKNLKKFYKSVDEVIAPTPEEFKEVENMPSASLAQQLKKKKAMKNLVNRKSKYVRGTKPLLDSKRMLKEKENFTHLEDIRKNYNEAKKRTDAAFEEHKKEIERLEAQRKADVERRKQKRAEKKNK